MAAHISRPYPSPSMRSRPLPTFSSVITLVSMRTAAGPSSSSSISRARQRWLFLQHSSVSNRRFPNSTYRRCGRRLAYDFDQTLAPATRRAPLPASRNVQSRGLGAMKMPEPTTCSDDDRDSRGTAEITSKLGVGSETASSGFKRSESYRRRQVVAIASIRADSLTDSRRSRSPCRPWRLYLIRRGTCGLSPGGSASAAT